MKFIPFALPNNNVFPMLSISLGLFICVGSLGTLIVGKFLWDRSPRRNDPRMRAIGSWIKGMGLLILANLGVVLLALLRSSGVISGIPGSPGTPVGLSAAESIGDGVS